MKKPVLRLVAGAVVVVLLTAAGYVLYRYYLRPYRQVPGPIAAETVLLDLFGNRGRAGRVSLPGGRIATVWAQQPFKIGAINRVAVLVAIEKEGGDCHGCPASLAVAVYRSLIGGGGTKERWELESTNRELGQVGSFGQAGSPTGLEARAVGPGKAVLLVPSRYTNQGFTESGSLLFIYAPTRWTNAGYVMRAEDNAGECSNDAKKQAAAPTEPCWSYTSELALVPGDNPAFYDVRITKRGTYRGKPVQDATYAFNGKVYREQ